jgi:hypothetical protein
MQAKHIRFRGGQNLFNLPICYERSKGPFWARKVGQPQKTWRNHRLQYVFFRHTKSNITNH